MAELETWREEPSVYGRATLRRGKNAPAWALLVRKGNVIIRATEGTAAVLSWAGLLHAVFRSARDPGFRAELRKVLDAAEAEAEAEAEGEGSA